MKTLSKKRPVLSLFLSTSFSPSLCRTAASSILLQIKTDINLKKISHSKTLAYRIFPFSLFLSPSLLSIVLSFRESINTSPHARTLLALGLEAEFNVSENQPISS